MPKKQMDRIKRKYGTELGKMKRGHAKTLAEYYKRGVPLEDARLIASSFELLKKRLREFRSKKENMGKSFTASTRILMRAGVKKPIAERIAVEFEDKYFNELLCTAQSVCFVKFKDSAKKGLKIKKGATRALESIEDRIKKVEKKVETMKRRYSIKARRVEKVEDLLKKDIQGIEMMALPRVSSRGMKLENFTKESAKTFLVVELESKRDSKRKLETAENKLKILKELQESQK